MHYTIEDTALTPCSPSLYRRHPRAAREMPIGLPLRFRRMSTGRIDDRTAGLTRGPAVPVLLARRDAPGHPALPGLAAPAREIVARDVSK